MTAWCVNCVTARAHCRCGEGDGTVSGELNQRFRELLAVE